MATGGYALKSYDQYAKLRKGKDGLWRIAHPKIAQQYRLNVGTIVEAPMLKVRLVRSKADGRRTPVGRGGRVLGEMEEYFLEQMAPGDTFLFGGEVVRFEGIRENEAYVSRTKSDNPMIPSYMGGKFPLSTYLAEGVRAMLATPSSWKVLPAPGARLAGDPEGQVRPAGAGRPAGGNLSRAPTSITWSATRSRAALPTRPSACC